MGFFSRVSDMVTANISDLLDRMENPEKMMKQLVREMEAAVAKTKDEVVKAVAHERRVEKEIAAHRRKIDQWQARAVEAVDKARDDLARKALELKIESQDILAALEGELEAARAAGAAMKTQMRAIQAKTQEARRKQASLLARTKTAGIRKKAAGAGAARKADADAFAEFARMEQKVEQVEAEAEAVAEVSSAEKAVEDEFAQWESGREIDAQLQALKKKTRKS